MALQPQSALSKSTSKKGGLKWDEQNLEENEKVKERIELASMFQLQAELPQVKISEPKTPYHAPLQGDESQLEPLDLDLEPVAGQHHHANDHAAAEKPADFAAARKKHYMKEALAASRKMIEEELNSDVQ